MKYLSVVILLPLLCGCMAGQDYAAPQLKLQNEWTAAKTEQEEIVTSSLPAPEQAWWQDFNDPVLTRLIERARQNNHDVKIAEARLAEAQTGRRGTMSGLFPQMGLNAGAAHSQSSTAGARVETLSSLGLGGTWDIDLFGGNRRRVEAADANIEASDADYGRALLLLTADVARQYILLRSLEKQRALTLRNLNAQRRMLHITREQKREGAISNLEVARAEAQASATAARLPAINTAHSAALNRIAVLIGVQPDAIHQDLKTRAGIPKMNKKPVVSTPIITIGQRPDIRAAERRLAQASALHGAASADIFPKLSLEGFFNANGAPILGAAQPWSLAAGAAMPLLNFGRVEAQIDAADARQQQALSAYKQTVLLALAETETVLNAYLNERKRKTQLEHVAQQHVRAATIALEQYKGGISTQLDVLTAAQNQLDAENAVALSEADISTQLVLLNTAMGRGASAF